MPFRLRFSTRNDFIFVPITLKVSFDAEDEVIGKLMIVADECAKEATV